MRKITLIAGLVVLVGMLPGCMMFDHTTDRSGRYDRGYSSSGGHSHH